MSVGYVQIKLYQYLKEAGCGLQVIPLDEMIGKLIQFSKPGGQRCFCLSVRG